MKDEFDPIETAKKLLQKGNFDKSLINNMSMIAVMLVTIYNGLIITGTEEQKAMMKACKLLHVFLGMHNKNKYSQKNDNDEP